MQQTGGGETVVSTFAVCTALRRLRISQMRTDSCGPTFADDRCGRHLRTTDADDKRGQTYADDRCGPTFADRILRLRLELSAKALYADKCF